MSNLGAALALGQLQRLPDLVQRKRNLRDRYFQSFARGGFGRFGVVHHRAKPNYWLNWIHMPSLQARDETMQALDEAGLKCRAMFTPIHLQKPYADCPYIVPDDALHKPAALLHDHIICLPSGPNL
jgi:dTDP-4-amino-4,6-dideoxygalactose transaminase